MIVLHLIAYALAGTEVDATLGFDDGAPDIHIRFVLGTGSLADIGQTVALDVGLTVRSADGRFQPQIQLVRETQRNVDLDVELKDATGRELKLRYRLEEHDAAFAPKLEPRASASASSSNAMALCTSDAQLSSASNVIDEEITYFYIAQPTNYSGDKWHIAIALLLEKRCKVIILKKDQTGDQKNLENGFASVYKKLGASEEQILRGAAQAKLRQISPDYWPKRAAFYAKGDKDPNVKNANRPVRMTFASTSIIMRAVEEQGADAVRKIIRDAFLAQFSNLAKRAKVDQRLAFLGQIGGNCVIVNMRCGHYHFEHNITETIYAQIAEAAGRQGLIVIRAGVYEPDYHPPSGRWMAAFGDATFKGRPADQRFIDVFDFCSTKTSQKVDEFATAYLWARVAQMPNVVGIIGGRSGSLDIAAFMGVRTLSWDIVDNDREYIRMLLAFPLMSCIRRGGLGEDGRERPKKLDEPSADLLNGTLNSLALHLWLIGREVIPDHSLWQWLPRATTNDILFQPLDYLEFLLEPIAADDVSWEYESDSEDPGSSSDEDDTSMALPHFDEIQATESRSETKVRSQRYGTLTIGHAVDNGNCCFDTVRQLLPVDRRPLHVATADDFRQFLARHYRHTCHIDPDADRVQVDGAYVSIDDIKELVRALNINGADVEIVIHFNAYGSTDVVPMASGHGGNGPVLHLLFASDDNGLGHISPLR
jgi:hypothetical protein